MTPCIIVKTVDFGFTARVAAFVNAMYLHKYSSAVISYTWPSTVEQLFTSPLELLEWDEGFSTLPKCATTNVLASLLNELVTSQVLDYNGILDEIPQAFICETLKGIVWHSDLLEGYTNTLRLSAGTIGIHAKVSAPDTVPMVMRHVCTAIKGETAPVFLCSNHDAVLSTAKELFGERVTTLLLGADERQRASGMLLLATTNFKYYTPSSTFSLVVAALAGVVSGINIHQEVAKPLSPLSLPATFEWQQYLECNPDLRALPSQEAVEQHYLTTGMNELRQTALPKYYLCAFAMIQNEERFLREWIEYQFVVGVEHIYLLDNNSTDSSRDIIMPYVNKGLVTYKLWTQPFMTTVVEAFRYGFYLALGETQWLAMLDSDEFMVPIITDNVSNLLRYYENYGALLINWQMFGTSGVETVPADKTMIEVLTNKALVDTSTNTFIKSIVQMRNCQYIRHQHTACCRQGTVAVNSDASECGEYNGGVIVDRIQLNHYYFRDGKFLVETKYPRRLIYSGHTLDVVQAQNVECNKIACDRILRFVPALRRRLFDTSEVDHC